jgi:polysaccharide biosynthesis transport protein
MGANKTERTIDLQDILAIVWRRKWLLIIPLILVTGIAYSGSYMLQERYSAYTIIWIDRPMSLSRELRGIIPSEGPTRESPAARRERLAALRNELTSQLYLSQLIEDLGLMNDPEVSLKAAKMREQNPGFSMEYLKGRILMQQLRAQIGVGFAGQEQIQLSVESHDPVLARDMVSKLAEVLEREKTRYEMERILDNQSFADMQLRKTEYDYTIAVDSLTQAQTRLLRQQLAPEISSEQNLASILSDVDQAEMDIRNLRSQLTGIEARIGDLGLERLRLRYTDSLVDLRAKIDNQLNSLSAMMERYPWASQEVTTLNVRIGQNVRLLEEEIAAAVDAQFASYPASSRTLLADLYSVREQIDILNSRQSQLRQAHRKMEDRIDNLPRLAAEVQELEQRVAESRRYRDAFRTEESIVEIHTDQTRDRTKYRVIEPATIPLSPIWPDRVKIGLMGLALGLVIGGGAVLLVELLDTSFKRIEEVEEFLGVKVLAAVPRIENLKLR